MIVPSIYSTMKEPALIMPLLTVLLCYCYTTAAVLFQPLPNHRKPGLFRNSEPKQCQPALDYCALKWCWVT